MSSRRDYHIRFARSIERRVAGRLRALGYDVRPTAPNSRYDLLLDGTLRVEIKAARPHENAGRTRYQALFHNRADVVILACVDADQVAHFVIPAGELAGSVNIAIWSDPAAYGGKWSHWLERWDAIDNLLADVPPRWTQGRLI